MGGPTRPDWDALVRVGRVARPHGLAGQVVVDPDTDFLEDRFQAGREVFVLGSDGPRALTIRSVRFHQGRPIVAFEGVDAIEAAEALGRGDLRMAESTLGPLPADAWFRHELVGCDVVTVAGDVVGRVTRVDGPMAASVLTVEGPRGEVLVPFTDRLCPEIRPDARRIVIDPPEGLLELNAPGRSGEAGESGDAAGPAEGGRVRRRRRGPWRGGR